MAIIDITLPPYSAVGDGVADDATPIQSAFTAAVAGDIFYFPSGTYRTTSGLTISQSNVGVTGDGVSLSVIKFDNVSPSDLLTVTGSTDYFRFERISLDASGQASNGLVLNGGFAHYSEFRNFRILSPIESNILINGNMVSCAFKSVSMAGGQYGIRCDETSRISGALFEHIRASNTLTAGVFLRNSGNSLHAFSIIHPTLEGNRGAALDIAGGMQCRVFGGHFEQNGSTTGLADILMGRFSVGSAPLCELHLFGLNFSTAGAAQSLTRIQFQEIGARLNMYGLRNTSTFTVDMNNKITGAQIASVMSTVPFVIINGSQPKIRMAENDRSFPFLLPGTANE